MTVNQDIKLILGAPFGSDRFDIINECLSDTLQNLVQDDEEVVNVQLIRTEGGSFRFLIFVREIEPPPAMNYFFIAGTVASRPFNWSIATQAPFFNQDDIEELYRRHYGDESIPNICVTFFAPITEEQYNHDNKSKSRNRNV